METQTSNEDIAIGRHDRHVFELYLLRLNNLSTTFEDYAMTRLVRVLAPKSVYLLLAFSSVLALLTSALSNFPFRTFSIVSRSIDTRAVYPASSERSLYEYITLPNASEEDSSRRLFVTKPEKKHVNVMSTYEDRITDLLFLCLDQNYARQEV